MSHFKNKRWHWTGYKNTTIKRKELFYSLRWSNLHVLPLKEVRNTFLLLTNYHLVLRWFYD